jgi:hypothetical protein
VPTQQGRAELFKIFAMQDLLDRLVFIKKREEEMGDQTIAAFCQAQHVTQLSQLLTQHEDRYLEKLNEANWSLAASSVAVIAAVIFKSYALLFAATLALPFAYYHYQRTNDLLENVVEAKRVFQRALSHTVFPQNESLATTEYERDGDTHYFHIVIGDIAHESLPRLMATVDVENQQDTYNNMGFLTIINANVPLDHGDLSTPNAVITNYLNAYGRALQKADQESLDEVALQIDARLLKYRAPIDVVNNLKAFGQNNHTPIHTRLIFPQNIAINHFDPLIEKDYDKVH